MNNFDDFFSIKVLEEVLDEFNWTCDYTLTKTASGNIIIQFPNSSFIIHESINSQMIAYFSNNEIGRTSNQESLTIFEAYSIIKSKLELEQNFKNPNGLINFFEYDASLEKVKGGVRNICILLQSVLLPCVKGDFSWIEEYNANLPE